MAVIFATAAQNPSLKVYADETRPLLQGARRIDQGFELRPLFFPLFSFPPIKDQSSATFEEIGWTPIRLRRWLRVKRGFVSVV